MTVLNFASFVICGMLEEKQVNQFYSRKETRHTLVMQFEMSTKLKRIQ